MPCHDKRKTYLQEYTEAAGIGRTREYTAPPALEAKTIMLQNDVGD